MRKMQVVTVIAVGCLLLANSGQAQILSNLPGTSTGAGTNLGLGVDAVDRTKAVGVTIGATAFNFGDVVALLSNGSPASELSGGIYGDSGGNPGILLAAFVPVPIPDSQASSEIPITTAAPFELQAGTTYWFVLDGPTFSNSLLWETLSSATPPTAGAGATYVGYRYSFDGGASWVSSSLYNGVTVNGVLVPVELQSFSIE